MKELFKNAEHRLDNLSINSRIFLTVIMAAAIAVSLVMLTHGLTKDYIESFFEDNDRWMELTDVKANELQAYITSNNLSTHDWGALKKWDNRNAGVYIYIYDPDRRIYESSQSVVAYGYEEYRPINFSDETADLSIYYAIDAVYYNLVTTAEIIVGVLIFFIIVMNFIRKLSGSIRKLESEVKILEGGGLEHKIKARSIGEIRSLEQSIDEMRASLKANMEREEELKRANTELVTRMAHDLRTPLTSLLLYLDLIGTGRYKNEEELGKYVGTARDKAERIKFMSDQLFERFLITGGREEIPEPPEMVRYILEDPLSSFVMTLGDQGFIVDTDIKWPDCKIVVVSSYINRIIDNAYSNILKYADRESPVLIELGADDMVFLRISNRIGDREHSEGGNNIGLDNIELMMNKMRGRSEAGDDGDMYVLTVFFPVK